MTLEQKFKKTLEDNIADCIRDSIYDTRNEILTYIHSLIKMQLDAKDKITDYHIKSKKKEYVKEIDKIKLNISGEEETFDVPTVKRVYGENDLTVGKLKEFLSNFSDDTYVTAVCEAPNIGDYDMDILGVEENNGKVVIRVD